MASVQPLETFTGRRAASPRAWDQRRDFPFYDGVPARLTAAQWLGIMAALAAAYAALLFGQQALPGRYGAYLGIAAFVGLPLTALRLTAGGGWTAPFHWPTARDVGVALACAPLTIVASAAVAIVLLQVGETAPNPAAAMLRNLQGVERIAFVAGTAPQILGEELVAILPFLGLLTLLQARGKLSRRTAILLAWIGSSLLFGALHLPTYQWRFGQALLVIGVARLALTLPYLLTKNLWSPTITHLAHDWSLFAVIFVLSEPA
jgi:membrane protease YdiL (CAAX protease family)